MKTRKKLLLFVLASFLPGAQILAIEPTTPSEELSFNNKPANTLEGLASGAVEAPPIPEKKEPELFLNFEDASLASVLNYLTDRQNVDVIPHKDLQNIKVSLLSRQAMTLSQAWETLYTLLEANGFTIATVDGKHRVISMQNHQQNPLPCFSSAKGVEPEHLEDSNKIIRYIYFCRNIKAGIAQGILTPLLAERSVQINAPLQACIITEKSQSIKSAMQIVKELDTGGMRQSIRMKPLKHTSAEHITRLFNEHIVQKDNQQDSRIRIISAEKKHDPAFFNKDTKILAEPMHNQLILMGTNDAIDRIVDFVDKYLDIPVGTAKSRLHVRELKYIAAEKLKVMLERIIQPPKGQGSGEKGGNTEGNFKFFEDVVISAETPQDKDKGGQGFGNRIIVSSSEEDWKRLDQFITRLDQPAPQVALEVMIVDVKTDGTRSLGAQIKPKQGVFNENINAGSFMLPGAAYTVGPTRNLVSDVRGTANTSPLSPHSTIVSFGDASKNDVWAMVRAAYNIDHTNILSQPYMITNNNSPAEETVTLSRKIPGKLVSAGNTQLTRRTETVEASIKTVITPRINSSGIIELSIKIDVGEFKETLVDSADKTNRQIITRVSMAAGEVLALGGLSSSKHDNQRWKVPILGDLPLIGNLFRDRTKNNVKKNLYIFVRPTVLRPHFGLGADEYTQLKLDYAKYQILGHDDYATNHDPVQRYFFAPNRYGIKNKLSDLAENRMPIIDNFAERKDTPTEVALAKDPYFRHGDKEAENTYEPEFSSLSMPHLKAENYVAPGLLEATMPTDILAEIQKELEAMAPSKPAPVELPDLSFMQRRGE